MPFKVQFLIKNKLILRFTGWYFLANTIVFWLLGLNYLSSILLSGSLFQNYIADYSSWSGKAFVLFFTLINYMSYMMLLVFIPAIFLSLLAVVIPIKRFIWFISVFTSSMSVILLLIDSLIYSMFKFHLSIALFELVFNNQLRDVFDLSQYELLTMISLIGVVIIVECLLAWFVWNKIILTERFKIGKTIATCWLGGMLFSYCTILLSLAQNNNLFIQQSPNLPLYNQLLSATIPDKNAPDIIQRYSEQHYAQAVFSHDSLSYPRHPMQCRRPDKPYNIILIMVDALRFDSMQLRYMPNISRFGQTSWQFMQHLSGGNSTQAGLFSLFYSIPSSYWTAALEQKKSPVFTTLLAKYGYTTQAIWSSEMLRPPMDKTIFLGFNHLNVAGAPGNDIGNWDRHTTRQAIQFLTLPKQISPFFLHLFYDAPHGYCRDQSFPTPNQPTLQKCSRIAMTNAMDPLPYYNRYLNAVTFIDDEVGQVLKTIAQQGYLTNSVIIFTSDHGQEFNDNHQNFWGHASNYTATQVHVPLIVYWPGESPRQIDYLTSGYDIVPTLLERLFACHNPVSDYSIGQNLLQKEGRLPFILAGSYVNMGIIEPDRLTTLQSSGGISITDLKAQPIVEAKPRMIVFNQVLTLMRMYFRAHPLN